MGSVVRCRQRGRRSRLDAVDGHGEGVIGDAGDADDLGARGEFVGRPPTDSATVLCAGQNSSGTHCTTSLSSHSNLPVIAGAELMSRARSAAGRLATGPLNVTTIGVGHTDHRRRPGQHRGDGESALTRFAAARLTPGRRRRTRSQRSPTIARAHRTTARIAPTPWSPAESVRPSRGRPAGAGHDRLTRSAAGRSSPVDCALAPEPMSRIGAPAARAPTGTGSTQRWSAGRQPTTGTRTRHRDRNGRHHRHRRHHRRTGGTHDRDRRHHRPEPAARPTGTGGTTDRNRRNHNRNRRNDQRHRRADRGSCSSTGGGSGRQRSGQRHRDTGHVSDGAPAQWLPPPGHRPRPPHPRCTRSHPSSTARPPPPGSAPRRRRTTQRRQRTACMVNRAVVLDIFFPFRVEV